MKLAILGTRGIPAQHGGFETFAENLSIGLAKKGIDVTVYCEKTANDQPAAFNGVHLEYFKARKLGPLSTIIFDIQCLWHARNKYDVVYMLGYGTAAFCFIPRLWGASVWINMDGIEWARSKWNWVAKLWFKLMETAAMFTAGKIIADAKGIHDFLKSRHKIRPPIEVIAYGAAVVESPPEKTALEELNLKPDGYYLIVCRLEPENHVLEIIKGYEQTLTPKPLVIVGSYSSSTSYVNSLLERKSSRTHFLGAIYDQEKLRALRYYCSAYFHGHSVGGTNPSLLEAMACGNKIIAHDNPFNREVAAEAGVYFKSENDIPALICEAEGINKELSHTRATARIKDLYTWDSIVERYSILLHSACPHRHPVKQDHCHEPHVANEPTGAAQRNQMQ